MKRKLTTIFCADVQNYSAMMSADEVGTHEKLKRYRKIIYKFFDARAGRKVNTWGDAVIGEFSSVVEAVRCGVEIQDAISAENRDLDPAQQMWLRIGINLGDVMEEEGDIYGEGVNVAARLEALAEPGGIMVSENVYNLSHKQLAIGYDYAGDQKVKDSDEPIASYRVRIGGSNQPDEIAQEEPVKNQSQARPRDKNHDQARDHIDHLEVGARGFFRRIVGWGEAFFVWFPQQPKKVQTSAAMIGFFFAINLLFSGIATPWFIFPSIPFALHIWRHISKNKNQT